jgi:hypothetical protein
VAAAGGCSGCLHRPSGHWLLHGGHARLLLLLLLVVVVLMPLPLLQLLMAVPIIHVWLEAL